MGSRLIPPTLPGRNRAGKANRRLSFPVNPASFGSARSLWFHPDDLVNFGVGLKNLAQRRHQAGELGRDIDRPKELLHRWSARIGEAQELIVVSILVSAAQGRVAPSFLIGR